MNDNFPSWVVQIHSKLESTATLDLYFHTFFNVVQDKFSEHRLNSLIWDYFWATYLYQYKTIVQQS